MIGSPGIEGAVSQMGAVPFGKIWRTGANEPTLLSTPVALVIAGVSVPAGTYSIYTVPGETEWEIIVNRSYSQWGQEGTYTDEVRHRRWGEERSQANERIVMWKNSLSWPRIYRTATFR